MTPLESNPSPFSIANSRLRIKHVIPTQNFHHQSVYHPPKKFLYCTTPTQNTQCFHLSYMASVNDTIGIQSITIRHRKFMSADQTCHPNPNFHNQSVYHPPKNCFYCTTPTHNTQCFHLSCMASVNDTTGIQSITIRHAKFTSAYQTHHPNPNFHHH